VSGLECRVQGSGVRDQGAGFGVQGSGCRVQGVLVAVAREANVHPNGTVRQQPHRDCSCRRHAPCQYIQGSAVRIPLPSKGHVRQSWPDSGLGLQVKVVKAF